MARFITLILFSLSLSYLKGETAFVNGTLFPASKNLSYIGIENQMRFALHYQYLTFGNRLSQSQYGLFVDRFFSTLRSGVALDFLQDVQLQNQLQRSHIGLTYSFRLQITETANLRFGLRLNYTLQQLTGRYVFSDQILYDGQIFTPPETSANTPIKHKFAASFGASFHSPVVFASASINNVLKNAETSLLGNDIPQPFTLNMEVGGKIILQNNRSQFNIYPHLLYEFFQNYHEIQIGAMLEYLPVIVGVYYSKRLSGGNFITGSVVFTQKYYSIGYGYKLNILDSHRIYFGSTHHLTVLVKLPYGTPKKHRIAPLDAFIPY